MILFEKDWDIYPNAIIHENTSNRSWVELAVIYDKMGINNSAFMLALMQPELANVDPFDPDLDAVTKAKIKTECEFNWWYFFREIARVAPQAGTVARKLQANRGNVAMYWCFANHVDFALEQIRQTGKSVSADQLFLGLMYCFARNSSFGLFTKGDDLRRANVERLKKAREFLPTYIYSKSRLDIDNQGEFSCADRNNFYKTAVGQKSEIAANNSGRGFTMPAQQWDETPFISLVDVTMPAALGSTTAVREEAEAAGRPYGNIYTTTSGDRDTREGRYTYKFFHQADLFNERYFDAYDREELYKMIVANGRTKKIMLHGVFNHRQLGKSDQWLAQVLAETNASGDAANKDFFLIWPSGNMLSPLTPEVMEAIKQSEKDPDYMMLAKENFEHYMVRWYIEEDYIEEFMANNQVILSSDTSDAVGEDSLTLVMSNIVDMSTIATLDINESNLYKFAKWLCKLLIKYPNITFNIEKKSSAQGIIDALIVELVAVGIDPFRRIFNRVINNPEDHPEEMKLLNVPMNRRPPDTYNKLKKFFGFNTTGDTRRLLYTTVLSTATRKAASVVRDKTLAKELLSLVVRDGRIDHKASGNDDMVIAWLLNEWTLTHGRNLSHYGIDPTKISSKAISMRETDIDQELEDEYQQKLLEDIELIYEQLKSTIDPFKIKLLEKRLRHISKDLKEDPDEGLSIDAMIKRAETDRKQRFRLNHTSVRYF